jgi:hypothetical protein
MRAAGDANDEAPLRRFVVLFLRVRRWLRRGRRYGRAHDSRRRAAAPTRRWSATRATTSTTATAPNSVAPKGITRRWSTSAITSSPLQHLVELHHEPFLQGHVPRALHGRKKRRKHELLSLHEVQPVLL